MEKTFYLELKAEVLFKIPVQAETFSQAYEKIKNVQYNTLADLSQCTAFKVLKTQKRAIYKMYNQEYAGKITIYD